MVGLRSGGGPILPLRGLPEDSGASFWELPSFCGEDLGGSAFTGSALLGLSTFLVGGELWIPKREIPVESTDGAGVTRLSSSRIGLAGVLPTGFKEARIEGDAVPRAGMPLFSDFSGLLVGLRVGLFDTAVAGLKLLGGLFGAFSTRLFSKVRRYRSAMVDLAINSHSFCDLG